jgi:hypothetical protein
MHRKNARKSDFDPVDFHALLNTLCYGTFIPPQAEGDRLGQNERGSELCSACASRRIAPDLRVGVGTVPRLMAEA